MSFWTGRKTLVTGATGLIGGPLCKRLLEAGATLEGYDMEVIGTLASHGINGQFGVRIANIMDTDEFSNAMRNQEVVIHLAAISGVEQAKAFPADTYLINTLGTLNVLEACRLHGIQAVVTATSNHIYGRQPPGSTPETASLNHLSTYSVSKIAADYITRSYAETYGVPTAVVRNTNCFGPYDPHSGHIIPGTILSVMRGERPVIRGTGETKKAYLYVDDVAAAYMAVAEYVAEGGEVGQAFNATTTSISVRGLVDSILMIMRSSLEPEVLGEPDDQSDEFLDDSKIHQLTGWKAQWPLEMALEKTIMGLALEKEAEIAAH